MERHYRNESVSDARIVGNGHLPSQQEEGQTDYWCSYLLSLPNGHDIGLQVTVSGNRPPYVTEMDVIPVNDTTTYDVESGEYSFDEVDGYGDDIQRYRDDLMRDILDDPSMQEQE